MSNSGFFSPCAEVLSLSRLQISGGEAYEFEVLAEDSASLEARLNKADVYQIEEETVMATLSELVPSSRAREVTENAAKAVLRGVLIVTEDLEQTSFLDTLLSTDYMH